LIFVSLPSQGAWIEIFRRTVAGTLSRSLPSQGAWIEILFDPHADYVKEKSLPSQGAWIEMALCGKWLTPIWSLPSQGAWIEISSGSGCGSSSGCRSLHRERGLKYKKRL